MSDDSAEPPIEEDTDDGLSAALIDGDVERAVALLRGRSSLSTAEIEVLADLLEGDPANEKIYRQKLKFAAWRPGRPLGDPAEARAASLTRAMMIKDLVAKGVKQTAAIELIREKTGIATSQLKRDLLLCKRHLSSSGHKTP